MPECNHCDRSFVDKQAVLMHTESKHGFECTHCNRKFKTPDGRDEHERTKHAFRCDACNQYFGSQKALDSHDKAKHPPAYECRYCDREFRSQGALGSHERTKHNFHCDACNREFSSQGALDSHDEAKHPPAYECRHCDEEFASDGARIQHQNKKHPPRPRAVRSSSAVLSPKPTYSPAAPPTRVEKPSVNVFGTLSTPKSIPERSGGEDVKPPKVEVAEPVVVANFACGTCGEFTATILALEAHESQHRLDSCACTICERAERPCNCNICKRTCTSVNETLLDRVVIGEPEETTSSVDSPGDVELKAVEDSVVGSCDFVMSLESQEAIDPSVDRSGAAHGVYSHHDQPLTDLEHEVDGEQAHDLIPPLSPRQHQSLDDPTCLSDVDMNLTEESNTTDLQLGFAPVEYDAISCELDILDILHSMFTPSYRTQQSMNACMQANVKFPSN
ncbi:uncharacterized protein EDB93DRAFT_765025 [Suillus bovinus]|uniref:uncharacterized protein n=1 Tax=Suillus bovinus TaxID=48563 RepID=UPI001B867CAD|nr:uncharacterized protein EDB93DRAFT_765025 [Suillus bovinus]KAG2137404.1 hypothetical protein EDB93DRAFT_765025 [Suillus bovinus]